MYSICQIEDTITIEPNEDRSFSKGWVSDNYLLAWQYGFHYFKIQDVNEELQNKYGSSFANNLGAYGVTAAGTGLLNRKIYLDHHLDVMIFHSYPLINEYSDSLKYYYRGFYVGLDGCKDLFPKKKNFDFILGTGFNTGRLLILTQDLSVSEKHFKYANPFFAPKINIETRVILFNWLTLSVRSELQFDVTNPVWNRKDNSLDPIKNSMATCYNINFTLGFAY